jgi:lipopolysaccharide transport protein LptA
MTGVVQKFSAIAFAVALGLLPVSHLTFAFAQDEPEPESTPIEEPQSEPTVWTPVTAGDAERGAPAASSEAAPSPVTQSLPTEAPSPADTATEAPSAASTPSARSVWHPTTISRERSPSAQKPASASESPAAIASPSSKARTAESTQPSTSQKSGAGGPAIVPENSAFAGTTFGKQKGPINIKSDTANLDYQNKAVLFTGHVHAVQAGGDLTSDALKVQYGQDFNDVKMMYSDGNVRMSQGTRWITSDHAVLDQTKHILTFHGNPVAHDGEDQITGSVITVDMVTGKSNVENPRVVIFPRESKNPDNEAAPETP